jgi:hypothetical protein
MAQTDQGESHGCCSKRKRFRRCLFALLTFGIMIPFYWMPNVWSTKLYSWSFNRDIKRRTEAKLQVADQYCFVAHNRKHNQHQQEAKATTTDELNKEEINQKLNP